MARQLRISVILIALVGCALCSPVIQNFYVFGSDSAAQGNVLNMTISARLKFGEFAPSNYWSGKYQRIDHGFAYSFDLPRGIRIASAELDVDTPREIKNGVSHIGGLGLNSIYSSYGQLRFIPGFLMFNESAKNYTSLKIFCTSGGPTRTASGDAHLWTDPLFYYNPGMLDGFTYGPEAYMNSTLSCNKSYGYAGKYSINGVMQDLLFDVGNYTRPCAFKQHVLGVQSYFYCIGTGQCDTVGWGDCYAVESYGSAEAMFFKINPALKGGVFAPGKDLDVSGYVMSGRNTMWFYSWLPSGGMQGDYFNVTLRVWYDEI